MYFLLSNFSFFISHSSFHPIFTEVMVSEPPTALSLKKETLSLLPFNANVYNKGR
jgi:hypothetical protein